jgi:hypothetical protein
MFDAFVAASWRGADASAAAGVAWFEAHWTGQAPPEPDEPPAAASLFGAAGHGIRWYARGDLLLGYAGRAGGCYQVTPSELPPAVPDPWECEAVASPEEDRLLGDLRASSPAGRGMTVYELVLDERTAPRADQRPISRR